MIEAGARAPDFTLPDQDGDEVSLADFAGSRLVLAFYPLDFSPVCTDQLSIYQEVLGEIEAQGAKLAGISVDSAFCHAAFREKLGLTFPLLADFHPKGEVGRRYGVYLDDYGYHGRANFVVDPEGRISFIQEMVPSDLPDFDALIEAVGEST